MAQITTEPVDFLQTDIRACVRATMHAPSGELWYLGCGDDAKEWCSEGEAGGGGGHRHLNRHRVAPAGAPGCSRSDTISANHRKRWKHVDNEARFSWYSGQQATRALTAVMVSIPPMLTAVMGGSRICRQCGPWSAGNPSRRAGSTLQPLLPPSRCMSRLRPCNATG